MINTISKSFVLFLHRQAKPEYLQQPSISDDTKGALPMGSRFVPYLAYPAQACRQGALPELTNAHSLTRIILIVFIVRELV